MPTAVAACLTAACGSGPVGDGDGPHHLHQQDRRLPGVPEPGLSELRDHQRQGLRDEHRRARQRRRVCEYPPQRWGGGGVLGGVSQVASPRLFSPHRKSTPFPSSSRPSGMARSWSPQYPRWFDGRRETRLPPPPRPPPPVHLHPPPPFFLRVTTFQTDPPADPRLGPTAVLPPPTTP